MRTKLEKGYGKKFIQLLSYLDSDASIVNNKSYESAIVKVIDGRENDLSISEELTLGPFPKRVSAIVPSPEKPRGILQVLHAKKRKVCASKFVDLSYIAPTSNVVERLFSSARLVLTDYRKAMTPYTFECVMFLKFNRKYWDLRLLGKLVNKD